MASQGIEETRKLIAAIKNGSIEIIKVDFEKVAAEVKDVDSEEAKDLLIDVGSAVIEILAAIKMSSVSGPVFSLLLKKII